MTTRKMEAKAIISAQDNTGRAFASVAAKMKALDSQTKALNRDARRNAMMGGVLGAAAGALGPAVVGAGMLKATQASLKFERSMFDVEKAADLTGAASKRVGDELLDLSVKTGKSATELAAMYAAAGFAGRPVQDLARFTEYAAKATTAWGTSAEETGQALAQIGNSFQADQPRIEQIADAIDYVADKTAASETALLDFTTRSASTAYGAKISAEQMLAFAATFRSVGTETSVASEAFNKFVLAMQLGDSFLSSSDDGFKKLGLDAAKMQKEFAKKPVETMVAVLERLNKVTDSNKRADILNDIFGKEYGSKIATLLSQLPQLKKTLGLVADQANYTGNVTASAAKQAQKNYFQLDQAIQAGNRSLIKMGDLMLKIGNGAAPAAAGVFNRVTQGTQNVIDAMDGKGPIAEGYDTLMGGVLTGFRGAPSIQDPKVQLQAAADKQGRDRIDAKLAELDKLMIANQRAAEEAGQRYGVGSDRQHQFTSRVLGYSNHREAIVAARDAYDSAQADLTDNVGAIRRFNAGNRMNTLRADATDYIPGTGSGTSSFGFGPHGAPAGTGFKVDVDGEATVKQEIVVKFEAGTTLVQLENETRELNREVRMALRQIAASNGPGSRGTSSPDVGGASKMPGLQGGR